MSTVIERPAAKPKCGRCYKEVDTAVRVPIVKGTEVIGWKLTYKCHGEEKSLDVLASWFAEPGNETNPFIEKVFEPIVVAAPTVAEALQDDFTVRMRDKANIIRDFISDTIKSIIDSQLDFDGDYLGWVAKHDCRIEISLNHILEPNQPQPDWRSLIIDGKQIGSFHVPQYLDEGVVRWEPTRQTKAI